VSIRCAAWGGAIAAVLSLFACAPQRAVLLPSPPPEVRREAGGPAASEITKTRQAYAKAYAEAIAKTKEALSRGAGKEALPLWKALEGSPWEADAIFHQGVLLHLAQDIDGAAAQYLRLAERSPVHEPGAANLLGIYLLRGDLRKARVLADRVLPAGAGLPPGILPELAANVAATLVEQGDYDRAAMLLLAMRARKVSAPSLSWNMAVLAYRKGNLAAARRYAAEVPPETANLLPVAASRFAWDRDSANAPPMDNVPATERRMAAQAGNLAAFLEYRKGNPAGAETLLTRRPEDAESFPEILVNAGLARMEQGKWKEARASFENAVKEKPEMPEGWIGLGIFKEIYEGDAAEALECYRRYVTLNGARKDEVGRWIEWLEKSPPQGR